MKIIKFEEYTLFGAAVVFVVAGSIAPFHHRVDFEPRYRSHFEVPWHQDLPAHNYTYENASSTTMTISGSVAPSTWQEPSGYDSEVFKLG